MRNTLEYQLSIISTPIYWGKLLRHILPLLGAGLLFSALWIGVAYAISKGTETPLAYLTRDTAATLNVSFYYGMISTLGIMMWAAASAISIMGAILLFDKQKRFALMLLAAGVISLIMNIDDAFMFHESILPDYLGLPEKLIMVSYIFYMAGYLVYFRNEIFVTDYPVLGLSLFAFGMSSTLDMFLDFNSLNTFLEDGFKFTGIVLWFIYYTHLTITTVRDQMRS